jgi:hypothetical protein
VEAGGLMHRIVDAIPTITEWLSTDQLKPFIPIIIY